MLDKVLRMVFPPKCIFCGQLVELEVNYDICHKCYLSLPFKDNANKQALYAHVSGYLYDQVICVFEYVAMVKNSLKDFKFYNSPGYYKTFGKLLSENIHKVTKSTEFDIIISVPLHKERLHARGYNQSYLISKVVSKELGLQEGSDILCRIKNTKSQSLLDKDERKENIKDAFSVDIKRGTKLTKKRIILVDDILTTGNTLNECSKVLKEAGADIVVVAVVASGKIF